MVSSLTTNSDMNNKTFSLIMCCFFGSIGVVVFLQEIAVGPNFEKNDFIRIFPPHFIQTPNTLDLKNREYYIAGLTEESIYLGNYKDASLFSRLGWDGKGLTNFHLQLSEQNLFIPSSFHLSIDSPAFYINNFTTGSIFKGLMNFPGGRLSQLHSPVNSNSIFIPVSKCSFAIRTFDQRRMENVLGKLWIDAPQITAMPALLEKQSDGVFSTDGLLRFDKVSGLLVYIYFYRNQYICMDSNFNLKYRGHTIDTNAHAKIRLVTLPSEAATTFASPGFRVNRTACVSSDWIFINSDLRADNEEENIFKSNLVVDVYSLKFGRYHFSFYLPKLTGKITDLSILRQHLVVIQDHWLTIYPLDLNEIKNPPNP
jgi:hypothetical protein